MMAAELESATCPNCAQEATRVARHEGIDILRCPQCGPTWSDNSAPAMPAQSEDEIEEPEPRNAGHHDHYVF